MHIRISDLYHRGLAGRVTRPEAVQMVFDSWEFLKKEKDFHLTGYVVLENHLHLLAAAPELSSAIKSFKRYTARQIIDLLESRGSQGRLRQLHALNSRMTLVHDPRM